MEREKRGQKRTKLTVRILCFVIALVLSLNFIVPAEAKKVTYIQSTVDLAAWEIITAVVQDDIGVTSHSQEIWRVDADDLASLVQSPDSLSNAIACLNSLSSAAQPECNRITG